MTVALRHTVSTMRCHLSVSWNPGGEPAAYTSPRQSRPDRMILFLLAACSCQIIGIGRTTIARSKKTCKIPMEAQ